MLQLFFATFKHCILSNVHMNTEEVLINKVVKGDLFAFKQLIAQHERLVTHMIARIIDNEEDVKDISQEVFIKIFKNLAKFNFNAKLSTWIAQIAYRTAINYATKHSGQKFITFDDVEHHMVNYETPEHILNAKNESEFLQYHISRLPLHYKTVVTLYHLNGFAYHEIEEITGMPEGTVKNYLFRARKLLKQQLEKHYTK